MVYLKNFLKIIEYENKIFFFTKNSNSKYNLDKK